ncbi:G-protein coupled receptor 4-like isoform X2 [Micropterus salmoides]|uniref:G-protein coupled receptor 4-like isoform X2 n=1 Tax=Micropterus salmoides TaxID=27706 RepID=UPI0018EC2186|nr:G-protein coupled receptor 4-like isoform X2 [Micropterus salmoides]
MRECMDKTLPCLRRAAIYHRHPAACCHWPCLRFGCRGQNIGLWRRNSFRMEDYYITSSSQDQSYGYSSTTSKYHIDPVRVVTCIIVAVGLPLTLVAIYALYSMVRRDQVAPIYLINLLISDILQFCCMIVWVAPNIRGQISDIFLYIHFSALFASICFMVCISLERYLVIAHPLWYHFRRTIKTSVVLCVLVWVLCGVCAFLINLSVDMIRYILFPILLLLPFPLLIFFLVGTLKALSASTSVPSDEKRRIVGILVLVLLIYTLLFLPRIICFLKAYNDDCLLLQRCNFILNNLSIIFLRLSPLADLFLYVLMRKGFIDKLLASVCCCRMNSNDISSPSV